MHRSTFHPTLKSLAATTFCAVLISAAIAGNNEDWPAWRGPTADGQAVLGQSVPTVWSETSNVTWSTPIPGRGHGSPTIVGNRIFIATAIAETEEQVILCLDRKTGKQAWSTTIHKGHLDAGKHRLAGPATATVACDGERIYINFPNQGAIFTTALSLEGKIIWQKRICDFVMHQGFGVSPVVHGEAVLVNADNKGGGTIAALDRKTGALIWSHQRPQLPNYTTPSIVRCAG